MAILRVVLGPFNPFYVLSVWHKIVRNAQILPKKEPLDLQAVL